MRKIAIDFLKRINAYHFIRDSFFFYRANELSQRDFFSKNLEPGNLVFDVGANLGNKTKIFLDLGTNVIAFEPQPYCFSQLSERFSKRGKIVLENIALGPEANKVSLNMNESHTLSTISKKFKELAGGSVFKEHKWKGQIEVEQQSLDEMIKKYGVPDFVKIDVEGYEYEVLLGLTHAVKMISIEFMPMADLIDRTYKCVEYLKNMDGDYRFNFTLGENIMFMLDEAIAADEIIKSNVLMKQKSFGDLYAFKL